MGLTLQEVFQDSDFTELISCLRAVFTSPGTPLWPLSSADYRPDPALQQVTLEETTNRLLTWHQHDPTSHWLKIVDDESGKIVGGGRWALYENGSGNPYEGHGEMEATWFEEGDRRDLASGCLNQFLGTSARLMNRPHAFLNILFTHPDYRRKGVASLIMKWGLEHADRLELESYIEATKEGKPCYEAFGFGVLETNELRTRERRGEGETGEELREAEKALVPFRWWRMYRPAKA